MAHKIEIRDGESVTVFNQDNRIFVELREEDGTFAQMDLTLVQATQLVGSLLSHMSVVAQFVDAKLQATKGD